MGGHVIYIEKEVGQEQYPAGLQSSHVPDPTCTTIVLLSQLNNNVNDRRLCSCTVSVTHPHKSEIFRDHCSWLCQYPFHHPNALQRPLPWPWEDAVTVTSVGVAVGQWAHVGLALAQSDKPKQNDEVLWLGSSGYALGHVWILHLCIYITFVIRRQCFIRQSKLNSINKTHCIEVSDVIM